MSDLNLQYLGFLNTPNLWDKDAVYNFNQFDIPSKATPLNISVPKDLRLGKLVERFVSHQLRQDKSITILAENIQIQEKKHTLGELDCLFKHNNEYIHLEIIYKFYLYDNTMGNNELSHWIGPNRRDSLLHKLSKLREKQFPLLYLENTKSLLSSLHIESTSIKQHTCFKAQLFIPFGKKSPDLKVLNPACIKGFYIQQEQLIQFANCKFYIPQKINWLNEVQTHINWKKYTDFVQEALPLITNKKSPLCWIKFPNGEIQKCFIVWW